MKNVMNNLTFVVTGNDWDELAGKADDEVVRFFKKFLEAHPEHKDEFYDDDSPWPDSIDQYCIEVSVSHGDLYRGTVYLEFDMEDEQDA